MRKKRKGKPKARINLRVEEDLAQWVKRFADEQGTTMTAIVVGNFVELRRRYGGAAPQVEQI
jgi:uncharacterized protein (DUF1778 family)